tara:strand:- start:278 stop:757 length:480 start_codon:yes stop_codon:yes gene_type:complete
MQCPACQNTDSRVLESRSADSGRSVRRRRECLNCDFRFTTYERVETIPITVIKRNGNRETFSRVKLLNGITRACEKTAVIGPKVEFIVDEIETQFHQKNLKDIQSSDIGEMVLYHLKKINEVAYIRFASVYRNFHSVDDFIKTLKAFKPANKDQFATIV